MEQISNATSENAAFMKAEATKMLMTELLKGLASAEQHGWVSEEEADRILSGTE